MTAAHDAMTAWLAAQLAAHPWLADVPPIELGHDDHDGEPLTLPDDYEYPHAKQAS